MTRRKIVERYQAEKMNAFPMIVLALIFAAAILGGIYIATSDSSSDADKLPLRLLPLPERGDGPAIPAFTETPDLLLGIQDDTLGQMQEVHSIGRDYLLHKARLLEVGVAATEAELKHQAEFNRVQSLIRLYRDKPFAMDQIFKTDAERYRGSLFSMKGLLVSYWKISLGPEHPSALRHAYMGLARVGSHGNFFFLVEDDLAPDDLSQNDWIDVQGYYLQNYYDTEFRVTGPLLIGRRVLASPPAPFVERGEVLDWVNDDLDTPFITDGLHPDAFFYLLHKACYTSQAAFIEGVNTALHPEHLFRTPGDFRGEIVKVRGRIVKPFSKKKLDPYNSTRVSYVWEGQITSTFYDQDLIITINFIERPEFIDHAEVEFYGFFLQRFAYQSQADPNELWKGETDKKPERMPISIAMIGRKVSFPGQEKEKEKE